MTASAHDRWLKLWRQTGSPAPEGWYERLHAAYTEAGRHYHNLRHIQHCLDEFEGVRLLAARAVAVEFAIWFHDAVYDPRRHDNEALSAVLARQCLGLAGLDVENGAAVEELIMATRHLKAPVPGDSAIMCDVDLAILGQPEARFVEFEAEVRREYEWVPQPTFAAGRAEILQSFLQRQRIYATDWFFNKYEETARANLRRSIKSLLG